MIIPEGLMTGRQKDWKLNDVKCSSGKKAYFDNFLAEEALIQHQVINDYGVGEGPVNVYLCDDCGYWHFTSKGKRSNIFDDPEVVSRIKADRRANYWERKLR